MIYRYRNRFLDETDIVEQMRSFVEFQLKTLFNVYLYENNNEAISENFYSHNEFAILQQAIARLFGVHIEEKFLNINKEEENEQITSLIFDKFNRLQEAKGMHLKFILLKTIDDLWRDHLYLLDSLRNSVNLKAYAQKDPLNEYKKEAFVMFETLLNNFRDTAISFFFHLDIEEDKKFLEENLE
jgi:preprotein translocase subunit SecA